VSVTIQVFGSLVRYSPSGRDLFELKIQKPISATELLDILGIPESEVWMITVNGTHAKGDHMVNNNDKVMIFEPVLGG
jgi:sulfur carrier protein ThiS